MKFFTWMTPWPYFMSVLKRSEPDKKITPYMVRSTPNLCNSSIPALELTLVIYWLTPQVCQHRYFYPFVMALPMFLSFDCCEVSYLATCSAIIPKRRWMPDLPSFHNIESSFHISQSAIISTLIDRAWYHVWTETEMFRCQMNQRWCDQDIMTYF